jgi:hypothetical protein
MFSKHLDVKSYSDKARSILFNLRDVRNPTLKQNVLFGIFSPDDIVMKDPKELASD